VIARHAMAFYSGGVTVAMLVAAATAARTSGEPLHKVGVVVAAVAAALVIPPATYALGLWLQRRYTGLPRHDRTAASFALGAAHAVVWSLALALVPDTGAGVLAFAALGPAGWSFVAMWLYAPLGRAPR
jgi:hypothetical protein